MAPAVLQIFKEGSEPVIPIAPKKKNPQQLKTIDSLPPWLINLNEPDIKYHHQVAYMRFDTDAFYPTVNNYKTYQRKLRKTIVKMKNNESHWKANARKEVVILPNNFF
jgi:hypothetical protein